MVHRNHVFGTAFSHQTRAHPFPEAPSALVQDSAGSSQCAFSIYVCVRNEEPASFNTRNSPSTIPRNTPQQSQAARLGFLN